MSGASGKVPAAIHLVPEAIDGGLLAKLQDGDMISLNAETGELAFVVIWMSSRVDLQRPNPLQDSVAVVVKYLPLIAIISVTLSRALHSFILRVKNDY